MTLGSQVPRTPAVQPYAASRSKLIPITLAVAASLVVAGGTYYFSSTAASPSADRVATNPVPPALPAAAQPAAPVPQVKAQQQPVAMAAPAPAPVPTPAPALPAAQPASAAAATALPAAAASAVIPAKAPEIQPPSSLPAPAPGSASLASAQALMATDPVAARLALTQLLDSRTLNATDFMTALQAIQQVNAQLFFSSTVAKGDSVCTAYTVQSGDTLAKIARKNGVQADWRLIQRMNGIKSEKSLRVGQVIKLPVTAFHAEVSKSGYLMRVYAGEGPTRVMIAAFPVGLGEFDSTPTGVFMVRPKSKLINPEWKNPRTGEQFAADDPKNPIGERWIGLLGVEAHNQGFKGLGIHGTVDQGSIGKQQSMGCVRMGDREVETVYEMLTEPNSTVLIAP